MDGRMIKVIGSKAGSSHKQTTVEGQGTKTSEYVKGRFEGGNKRN